MGKDLISFPDLVEGLGALDLAADAIRKAAGGEDRFSGKDTFKAIILKAVSGEKLTNKELAGTAGVNQVTSAARSVGRTRAYFVKIIEDSPHSYLPDPCKQASTGLADIGNNNLIQGMYTFAVQQDSPRPLPENTVVWLKLNKVDFSYDTDYGWIVGVIGAADSAVAKEFKCAKPSDAYNSATLDVGAFADLPINTATGGTKFIWAGGATETGTVNAFVNQLSEILKAQDIPELIISSGYRTAAQQASAMKNLYGGGCKGNIPGGAPMGGPCKQIYDLYGGGPLIKEALEVSWEGDALANVIQEQADRGEPISHHMNQLAFDLQTERITQKIPGEPRLQMLKEVQDKIIEAVKKAGGEAHYETSPPHMHVTMPGSIKDVVKQGPQLAQAVMD